MPDPDPKDAPQTRIERTMRTAGPGFGASNRLIEAMSRQGWRLEGRSGFRTISGIGTVQFVFERTVSMDGTLFWDGAQWRPT